MGIEHAGTDKETRRTASQMMNELGHSLMDDTSSTEALIKGASYWKQVAECSAYLAALFRQGNPLHFVRPLALKKFGEEVVKEAEKLIDEAI